MAATAKSSVGFVGIGAQGGPIAERILAAGFSLSVWARRREAAATLEGLGATVTKPGPGPRRIRCRGRLRGG